MSSAFIVTIVVIVVLILATVFTLRIRNKARFASKKTSEPQEGDVNNKQVYVGNLSYQVTEQNLKDFFSKYGNITQVRIVKNYSSGRSKGFGFVTFETTKEAENSLATHGQKYQERTIVVRIAKPR